jgi:diguanylate cyclase (GGDEF)-like protein/PAS domain S-box-containing protein
MKLNLTNTKNVVALGFTLVVVLMIFLFLIGVRMVENSQQRLDHLVNISNLKIELVSEMRYAARERTINLYRMLLLEDPFAQDEEWLQFNAFGSHFVKARTQMLELPLSPVEQRMLDLQQSLTSQVAPAQREVATHIANGEWDRASHMLMEKIMPGQDRTFTVLTELVDYQKDQARIAAVEAHAEFERTLALMLTLAVGFIFVTVFIARFVQRQALDSERRLFNAKEHAQVTLYSIGEGVICTNLQGQIEELNAAASALLGCRQHEAIGRPVTEVLRLSPEGEPSRLLDPVAQVLRQSGLVTSDDKAILHRSSGEDLAVEYTASPIYDRDHKLLGSILVFRDVTQMRTLSSQLFYHAHHDGLTGLLNRREFEARVSRALEDAKRHGRESWLCFIDLDQFKIINDTCGHLAGDEQLKRVAGALVSRLRDEDIVARLGGDEFAILIRNTDEDGTLRMVGRIHQEIQSIPFVWEDKRFASNFSMGVVPINHDSGTLQELFSTADSACYLAKEAGRNRIHLYRPNDADMARRHGEMQWVHQITEALEENRFTLYYQAIAPLKRGCRQRCGEILVRMLDPQGKLVPPMSFIPAAERYSLMGQIDHWVIRNTLEVLAHHRANLLQPGDWVSINLSAQSLCDEHFLDFVLQLLEQHHIDPTWLCFEVTETSAIANLTSAIEVITRLKDRGCRIALDDFGSGVSSFAYLKNLPVDLVKMDGGFVHDIRKNDTNLALVEAINRVGHVMGIQTVAEYVEDRRTAVLLRRLGVDYGQGYGIRRPVPLIEALAELNEQRAGTVFRTKQLAGL